MSRFSRIASLIAAIVLLQAGPADAQDFGKFLEQAGKDLLRKQLSPENIQRTLSPHLQGEPFPIQTADGWTLVAHRFTPARPRPGAAPVILCHGLSYNAEFWTLDPSVNLAQFLNERGYDVWVVSLRGCGLSQKWVAKIDAAPTMAVGSLIRRASRGKIAPTGYATLDPKYSKWNLDDHINYDVPAFVHLVRSTTRSPSVTWVGHSMGGIIALGHLARYQNPGIGKLVTVGSQVTMPDGQLAVQFLSELIQTRQGMITNQIVPEELAMDAKTSVDNMFFNQNNVSPVVYQKLTTSATDIPSIGLLQQYLVMATKGELLDASKQFSYARNMANVTVPILISCGSADQLAPPKVQQYLHQTVGSADKTLMIYGTAQGFAADSGHNDSLVGLTSHAQVYPFIEQWISAR